jgi:hypothetical protein
VRTLLERAKGSALDVNICREPPPGTISLISPRFRQIRRLDLSCSYWEDIATYSEISSGPLPLLHTLTVTPYEYGSPLAATIPPFPFFEGAVNLKHFIINSKVLNNLCSFIFPNLTTFKLSTRQAWTSDVSNLFDFLKASPKLRTVDLTIDGRIALESVPPEKVTVLSNVETFSLSTHNNSDVYEIAARISCPCAKFTSLIHSTDDNYTLDLDVFPTPALWSAISCQYGRSPVEEVTLEIKPDQYESTIACSLTSRSSDAATVRLCYRVYESGEDGVQMPFDQMDQELFSRVCSAAQDHPSLSHTKHLHIKHKATCSYFHLIQRMSDDVGELFDSMGSLDELTIHGCDLRTFLGSFPDFMDPNDLVIPVSFPDIKELTILHPLVETDEGDYLGVLVDLAELQHEKGIPFKHVTVRAEGIPTGMAERLREWVEVVECYEEECKEG